MGGALHARCRVFHVSLEAVTTEVLEKMNASLAASSMPDGLRALIVSDDVEPVWLNELGGLTIRDGDRYIKWNPLSSGIDLRKEVDRLAWAAPFTVVPRVIEFGSNADAQWMITHALPGESAVSARWRHVPLLCAREIGRGLRILHDALPVAACPFTWSIEDRTNGRHTAASLHAPPDDLLVVCHGDACSPNTLLAHDGSFLGHVDMGSLGVADRWADLAVASMALDWNYEPAFEDEFFAAYGIAPDAERIAFYRDLWNREDELQK